MSGKKEHLHAISDIEKQRKKLRDIICKACHLETKQVAFNAQYCKRPECLRARHTARVRVKTRKKRKVLNEANRLNDLTVQIADEDLRRADLDKCVQLLKDDLDNPEEAVAKSLAETSDDPRTLLVLTKRHEVLHNTLLEEKRQLGKESFWYFFTQCLFPTLWEENYTKEFHAPICDLLQHLPPGSNHMNVLSREARKTYIGVLGWSLYLIINDPNIRIMLIGAKEKTVRKWSGLTRSAFIKGTPGFEHFQSLYPKFLIEKRGKVPLGILEWSNPLRSTALADATFFSTYLGVTGAGGRCDVQIFDDPYERRNVASPTQSAKSLMQTMDLFPLVQVSGKAEYRIRLFNATRWAYHDPVGVLIGENREGAGDIDPDEVPAFSAMIRHAFEDPNRSCEHCPKHVTERFPHGHPDVENGLSILDPIITRADLERRFREYCTDPDRGESLWYHQYQNVCMAPKDQKIQREWCQLVATFSYFAVNKARVLCLDAADKDFQLESGGDYMVALFGEFDDYGRLLLVHGLRSNKWTREAFINAILSWCKGTQWWPHKIAKEKFGSDTFLTDIGRAFQNFQKPTHCLAVTRPGTSSTNFMQKLDWIVASLQGPLERSEVIFGRDFPKDIHARAEYELTHLGQTALDDVADTLGLFFHPKVRVIAPRKDGQVYEVTPPDLYLYNPGPQGAPAFAKPQNPIDTAIESVNTASAGLPPLHQGTSMDHDPPPLNIVVD